MRRIICILCILMLLPTCVSADYSDKTDDELKTEFHNLVSELLSRGIWATETIPAGLYVVGETIPAGNYQLTPLKHSTIEVYPTMEDLGAGHNRLMYLIFDEGESFTLTLSDGMVFELRSTCTIKPFGFSW